MDVRRIPVVILLALSLALAAGAVDPCSSGPGGYQLIDEPLRSTGYVVKTTDYSHLICDRLIPPGWYKFSGGNMMPTSCVQEYHCGTNTGLWMNGAHPAPGDGVVTRDVCGMYQSNCCGHKSTIQVKNCGTFYVYELQPTPGCSMAYCAGNGIPCPPNQWSPTGFRPGCVDAYPIMTQPAQLSNPIVKQDTFTFNCHLPFDPKRTDVGFEVTWLFDGHIDPKVPKSNLQGHVRDVELDQKWLEGHLGKNLTCAVRTYFTSSPGRMSPRTPSNGYWCGIKLSEGRLSVGENEKPREVKIISTIPIVCPKATQASCKMEIYLDPNNHDVRTTTACTQVLRPTDWNKGTNQAVTSFQVLAERDFKKDGDKNLELNFRPIFSVDSPAVFNNYHIPYLQIQTKDKPTSVCSCTGDPHCTTLDQQLQQGRHHHYNYYKVGEFTMYKSTSRPFEVQVRTWTCGHVTCTCAVSAREGNDVVTIDMCHGTYGHTFPKLSMQHQGQISQGTVVQKDKSGNTWLIYFPSGAWVKVVNSHGRFFNVYIQAPEEDFAATQGLCGTFDGNTDNDLTRKDGTVERFSGRPQSFVESWRVPIGQSFFDREVPVEMKYNNDLYFCNCDQQKKIVDCRIDGKAARPAIHTRCPGCSVVAQGTAAVNGNGRRRRQASSSIGKITKIDYDFDYGYMWNPVLPNFPTKSGRTQASAEKLCRDAFNKQPAIRACISAAHMDFTGELESCVEDLRLTDDVSYVAGAVEAAIMSCSEVVLKEPSFYDNTTGTPVPPAFITTELCPYQCSDQGDCIHGTCICHAGFTGDACQINANKPPELYSVVSTNAIVRHDYCDLHKTSCQVVDLVGGNMLDSNHLSCRLEELNFDGSTFHPTGRVINGNAHFDTMYSVGCDIPSHGHKIAGYNISVTNNGVLYSKEISTYIVDSTCMICPPRGGQCRVKAQTCFIENKCRTSGAVNPAHSTQTCNPSKSQTHWTDTIPRTTHSPTEPVPHISTPPTAPLGGAEYARFDIWTTYKSGCACSFNTSRRDCACCDEGGCQCPMPNQFQCVQCGKSKSCGTPLPGPDNGVDGYTLALADCSCDYDSSLSNCACCQNGGVQCPTQHKNQCVAPHHLERCGGKPWIFGPAIPAH